MMELLARVAEEGALGTQCMVIIGAMATAIAAMAAYVKYQSNQKDAINKAWNTFLQDQLKWTQSFKHPGPPAPGGGE